MANSRLRRRRTMTRPRALPDFMAMSTSTARGGWRHSLAVVAALLAITPAWAGDHVAFTTDGGDAWTFEKVIETSIAAGACDAVTFRSPAAIVTVPAAGDRALARV